MSTGQVAAIKTVPDSNSMPRAASPVVPPQVHVVHRTVLAMIFFRSSLDIGSTLRASLLTPSQKIVVGLIGALGGFLRFRPDERLPPPGGESAFLVRSSSRSIAAPRTPGGPVG